MERATTVREFSPRQPAGVTLRLARRGLLGLGLDVGARPDIYVVDVAEPADALQLERELLSRARQDRQLADPPGIVARDLEPRHGPDAGLEQPSSQPPMMVGVHPPPPPRWSRRGWLRRPTKVAVRRFTSSS